MPEEVAVMLDALTAVKVGIVDRDEVLAAIVCSLVRVELVDAIGVGLVFPRPL